MSTFLHRIAPDLAIGAVAGSLSGYGLHRLLPAQNVNFLVTLCVVNLCANIVIRTYVNESIYSYARNKGDLDDRGRITNPLLNRLGLFLTLTSSILLPIFYRYVGQRLGYQVPSYLETMGYLSLSGASFSFAKIAYDTLRDAYYSKPATKKQNLF